MGGNGRIVAIGFVVAGVLSLIGGQMHPRGKGDSKNDYLISMLGNPTWAASHLLMLAGLVVAVATFLMAKREAVFGPSVSTWLTVAAIGSAIGAAELVPHVAASNDLEGLQHHHDTPVLDFHLMMQVLATPALGITIAAVAIAVARDARTKAAWTLAVIAAISGVLYGLAGPLVNFTESVAVTPLFAAQTGVAIWLLGTGIRLLVPSRAVVLSS